MLATHKSTTIVGLDIECGSVAATEVTTNGSSRLGKTGIAALGPGITREGEVTDPDALGAVLKDLFTEQKLTRNVRVGIANQRVVVRMLRLPLIEKREELEAAIRFQAPDHIPMPLEQAVLDWQVADPDPETTAARQMNVVVVAARRDAVAGMIEALRVAGLKPIGVDVSAFAMIRALANEAPTADPGAPTTVPYEDRMAGEPAATVISQLPARLYSNLGDVTNLAVARGSNCLFTRVSSFGMEGIAQRLSEHQGLTMEHSRQWLRHVGLDTDLELIDGDAETVRAARDALVEGAGKLAGELRLSLDYYGTQESAASIEEVVLCGPGTAIPGLPERLQQELGYATRIARPAALSHLDDATAARLTLAYGLGLAQ